MRRPTRELWAIALLITAFPPCLQGADGVSPLTPAVRLQVSSNGAPAKPSLRSLAADDLVENGNLVVKGNACIGAECTDSDADLPVLKLKDVFVSILFDTIEPPRAWSAAPLATGRCAPIPAEPISSP